MPQLNVERATQRHRAYQLLSKIFAEGLTPAVRELATGIPSVAPVLPDPYDEALSSADFQELFGFNVLPFAGVFLTEDGQLGGPLYHRLNAWYLSIGFNATNLAHPPDHICTQLACLSYLSVSEIGAYRIPGDEPVTSAQRNQVDFLLNHIIPWAIPFLCAVKLQRNPFYTEIAELTEHLLINHLQENEHAVPVTYTLPPPPDILADPKTGLKEIAAYLVRPTYSGVYFSKNDIKSIASSLKIPTGFGDRTQLLSNTLRSAVTYNVFPECINGLCRHVIAFGENYGSLKQLQETRLHSFVEQWTYRTTTTHALLLTLKRGELS